MIMEAVVMWSLSHPRYQSDCNAISCDTTSLVCDIEVTATTLSLLLSGRCTKPCWAVAGGWRSCRWRDWLCPSAWPGIGWPATSTSLTRTPLASTSSSLTRASSAMSSPTTCSGPPVWPWTPPPGEWVHWGFRGGSGAHCAMFKSSLPEHLVSYS